LNSSILELMPPHWPGSGPSFPKLWIPAVPPLLLNLLPVDRERTYLARFADSHLIQGFVLKDTSGPPIAPNLEAAISQEFNATFIDREGPYTLLRYTMRTKG
jgi:hypothetical protein